MADFKKQRRIDLNPSSADRWTTCTASPKFIYDNWDKLPEQDRKFADEGVTAHEVASALLQNRKPIEANCPVPIKREMHQHAWDYMEFVESLLEPGGRILVEQKLPLFYAEGRNAIVDAAVINPNGLHIVDFKYGEGVIVNPENNLQLSIYAKSVVCGASLFQFPPPDNFPVSVTIYQPRTRNTEEPPFHTWFTTWGVIEAKARAMQATAKGILEAAEYKFLDPRRAIELGIQFRLSTKACQFCPAKGFCEARPLALLQQVSDLSLTEEERLAAVVTYGDDISKWVTDRKAYALNRMKTGMKLPGYKLALSRGGNRNWSNPVLATKFLLEDTILKRKEVIKEELITPAQVEKLIGKGKFPTRVFNLITKTPGVPVIVPEDDARESAFVDGTKEFEDLDA